MRNLQKLSAVIVSAAVAAGAVGANALALNFVDFYDDAAAEDTSTEYKRYSFDDELVRFSISIPDDVSVEIVRAADPEIKGGVTEYALFVAESETVTISSAYHISEGGLSAEIEAWKEMDVAEVLDESDTQGNSFYVVKFTIMEDIYYIGEYDLGGGAWVNVTVSGDYTIENPDCALDILRSFELLAEDFVNGQGEIQELTALGQYVFDAKRVSFDGDKCSFSIDIPAEFAVENTSADASFTIDEGFAQPLFAAESESDSITALLVECDGGAKSREEFWKNYTPNIDLDGNDFFCNMTSTSSYTTFHAEYPYDDNSYISFDILYNSKIDMDIADNIFYALFSFSKDFLADEFDKEVVMKRFECESDGLSFSIDVPEEIYSLVENGECYQNGYAASDGANTILQADLLANSYESEANKWNSLDDEYNISTHTDAHGNEFTLVEIPDENMVLAVYNLGNNMSLTISTELISDQTFTLMAESFSISDSITEETETNVSDDSDNKGNESKGSPDTGVGMMSLAVPACAAAALVMSRKKK